MTEQGPRAQDDVLLSAILDEALAPEAAADPETAAAHRAAVDDVAELRRQLHLLGAALADEPAAPVEPAEEPVEPVEPAWSRDPAKEAPAPTSSSTAHVPRPRPRTQGRTGGSPGTSRPPGRSRGRRLARRFAVGASALAFLAALVTGVSWVTAHGTNGSESGHAKSIEAGEPQAAKPPGRAQGDRESMSPEGYVACMRRIAEGEVTRRELHPDGTGVELTVQVTRWYKPARGPARITFRMDVDADPQLTVGQRTLLTFPKGRETHPDDWATGADLVTLRTMVVKALPASRKIECGNRSPRL
ncbi:hypothetical protein ACFWIA_12035 [Streptomyces sp. NPDC127068]|uniref:hypothetical protein n=1 Tax=Streptomyces sp. NPDC127068 TaxID=3347127 RepID=UPI00365F8577